MIPDLDDWASSSHRFRDFVEDGGETSGLVDNVPRSPETYDAIARLAFRILEPLHDQGFAPVITYGFCSPRRAPLVEAWRTYQPGDQHVGHELFDGRPICPRLGFAVDLKVRSAIDCFAALLELDYDRIYFYGDTRPIHVSVAPAGRLSSRVTVDMRDFHVKRRPKRRNPENFLRLLTEDRARKLPPG